MQNLQQSMQEHLRCTVLQKGKSRGTAATCLFDLRALRLKPDRPVDGTNPTERRLHFNNEEASDEQARSPPHCQLSATQYKYVARLCKTEMDLH